MRIPIIVLILLLSNSLEPRTAIAGLHCNVNLTNACSREGCELGPTRSAHITIDLTKGTYLSCHSKYQECIESEVEGASFTSDFTIIQSGHGATLKIVKKPNYTTYLESGEFVEYREEAFGVMSRYGHCSEN